MLPLTPLITLVVRLQVALVLRRRREDRGDVPGWVLITVMTAGLVMAIWGAAKGQLGSMLHDALASVHD